MLLTRQQEPPDQSRTPIRNQDRQLQRSSSQMSVNSVQSTSSATFEIPAGHQRKQRRRAKAVVGTGTSGNVRGAPEPSRDIFIFRVDKTTDADNMKRYMNNKNIDVREIELKSKEQSLYNSFYVRIKVTDLDTVLQPDFWPIGVNVRRYWQPRTQQTQSWK